MRVLVVEDSKPLRESLRVGLSREGFAVDVEGDGEAGLSRARNNPYDVLVLDLLLPKLDGLRVLESLVEQDERPHVMILTAMDDVDDRVRGLNQGADDYLVKPFVFDELVARIHALMRRRYNESGSKIVAGRLLLDQVAREVQLDGQRLELAAREYALVEYLMLRRGHVVTREEIEDHIYGTERLPMSNAVDSAICTLRARLGSDGRALIRTLRGRGYILEAKPA